MTQNHCFKKNINWNCFEKLVELKYSKMNALEQKNIMIPFVKNILTDLGFFCKKEYEYSFRKITDFGGIKMNFHFSDQGTSGNNLFSISHNSVEKIILEIGLPYNKLDRIKSGEALLYTVKDKKSKYSYLNEPIKIGSGNRSYIKNEEDIETWKEDFIKYISTEGGDFITKFSSLKNIHDELDKKFKSGEHNYLDLLLGRTDHLFRFLIISKMFDDPGFSQKLSYVENRITKADWISYFEKLKEKLLD